MAKTSVGAMGSSQAISETSDDSSSGSGRVFYSAIVIEYISNPEKDLGLETTFKVKSDENIDEEPLTLKRSLEIGENAVSNSSYVPNMPRNSVIAQRIDSRAAYQEGPEVFYPFFSNHLMLPVSPGEQVWITYDNGSPGEVGYWVCRKPGTITTEDLCFTHLDRQTMDLESQSSENDPVVAIEGSSDDDYDPKSFPLGGGRNSGNNTLPKFEWASATEDPYQDIIDSSFSYKNQFTGEPSPRWSPRSNDITIQGSNNTLISLGTDRVFDADNSGDPAGDPASGNDVKSFSGTIDIVAGRGQEGSDTAAVANFTNTRDYDEIDKTPVVTKSSDSSNMNEGDNDFESDLSRVYISMNTNGDTNFDLGFTNSSAPVVDEKPYIIAKSTEVRLIARDGGSVRMVKEGDEQCEICLMSDGTISIEGGTIYLGENSDGNTSQPVFKGTDLESALHAFADNINNAVIESVGNVGAPVLMPTLAAYVEEFKASVTAALSSNVYTK